MKFEIKGDKIYRKGEEINPYINKSGKVVVGTSAKGLWFEATTSNECFRVYKGDIINLLKKDAHKIFFKYWNNEVI